MKNADKSQRIGRKIAIGAYFSIFMYLTAAGFAGVIPKVFRDYPDPPAADICNAELPKMERTLRDYAGNFLQKVAIDEQKLEQDFDKWDQAFEKYRRCENADDLWVVRHRLQSTLHHMLWSEGKLLSRFRNLPNRK